MKIRQKQGTILFCLVSNICLFRGKQFHQQHAGDKTADMGPKRHALASLADAGSTAEQLEYKPNTQEYQGRDIDNLDENKDENQRQHPGLGEEDQVSAQDPRDGAAGAD